MSRFKTLIGNKTNLVTLAVMVSIVLLLAWFVWQTMQTREVTRMEQSPAGAAFVADEAKGQYTDIDGNSISLSDYLGSVLVVNSWASWSPFSAQELPLLNQLAELYEGREVVILAINRAEPASTAQAFLNSLQVNDSVQLILDPQDRYYGVIEGYAMPETVFYDTKGNVVFQKHGAMNLEEMNRYTDQALAASETE